MDLVKSMSENNNLEIWGKFSETDPKYLKAVSLGGRKFTSIDATYQIHQATTLWGPMGRHWGLRDINVQIVNSIGKDGLAEPTMILTGILFYPGGQIETGADQVFKSNNDTFKKLRTAAITKALAGLGFAADVFFGKFDDAQYAKEQAERLDRGNAAVERLREIVSKAPEVSKLAPLEERAKALLDSKQISGYYYDQLLELIAERRAELLEGENEKQ